MRNIFKTFKENKSLLEENKILKAQNEALMQFKESFDSYYRTISGVKFIPVSYDNQVILNSVLTLDEEYMHCPISICKERIADNLSKQLLPFIEFDLIDNYAYRSRDLIGKLIILTK